jgi:hypothetical protein
LDLLSVIILEKLIKLVRLSVRILERGIGVDNLVGVVNQFGQVEDFLIVLDESRQTCLKFVDGPQNIEDANFVFENAVPLFES